MVRKEPELLNYWLWLQSIPGIGPATFNKLLKKFGTPQKVFHAERKELLKVISEKLIDLIFESKNDLGETKHILFTLKQRGFRIITIYDPEYPLRLTRIPNPPPLIYVYGALPTKTCNIAIIGARLSSQERQGKAFEFACKLVDSGFMVVSGYAKGIDTYAHLGAIKGKGHTIMVLPTGVFNFRVHREFWEVKDELFARGTILSEFFPLAGWSTSQAILRNRLTSGLSDAVLVIEPGIKGGTLSTARWAIRQGKLLFIDKEATRLPNPRAQEILALGAIPVKNSEDLLKNLAILEKSYNPSCFTQ